MRAEGFTSPIIARLSLRASRVVYILQDGVPGETLSDELMAEVLGFPVDTKSPGYNHLRVACLFLESEKGIYWHRLYKEGRILCLSDVERLGVLRANRKQIHNVSCRAMRNASSINREGLSSEQLRTLNVHTAIEAFVQGATSPTTVKRLASRINEPLPLPDNNMVLARILGK